MWCGDPPTCPGCTNVLCLPRQHSRPSPGRTSSCQTQAASFEGALCRRSPTRPVLRRNRRPTPGPTRSPTRPLHLPTPSSLPTPITRKPLLSSSRGRPIRKGAARTRSLPLPLPSCAHIPPACAQQRGTADWSCLIRPPSATSPRSAPSHHKGDSLRSPTCRGPSLLPPQAKPSTLRDS